MDKKAATEMFKLFHMNEKTDGQIMAIMKSHQRDKEVYTVGISFLKSPDNIITAMRDIYYEEPVCVAGIKALQLENKTENEILALMGKVISGVYNDRQKSVVEKCFAPYFKLNKKKTFQIFNLLKKTNYSYWISQTSIKVLAKRVNKMSDEELLALIELSDYNKDIIILCIQYFKSEEEVLKFTEKESLSDSLDFILGKAVHIIKWAGKTENQILEVLRRAHYQSDFCEAALPFIEKEENLLFVMKEGHNYGRMSEVGIPLLQLELKDYDGLLHVMQESNYEYLICSRCLALMNLPEKEESVLMNLVKATEYNKFVCRDVIIFLKSTKFVLDVITKTNFEKIVCCAGLPLLKLSSDILFVMSGSEYDSDVCEIGILLLETEEAIFYVMQATKFNTGVCRKGVKAIKAINSKKKKELNK